MKVTHLTFNPYTLRYSLVAKFNNGEGLHMSISSDAAETMQKRGGVDTHSVKNGTGDYDKHCLYWNLVEPIEM